MSLIKYRIHEVAKDFNVASKVITQILTDYIAPPKNHMQVLETPELDVIFEYMTQHNQAESLEEIFKTPSKPAAPAKAKEETKAAEKAAAPADSGKKTEQKNEQKQGGAKPAAPAPAPAPKKLAPGAAGEVKLYDTDPRDAAMIMAIVANKLNTPLNELRFKSIKEVK